MSIQYHRGSLAGARTLRTLVASSLLLAVATGCDVNDSVEGNDSEFFEGRNPTPGGHGNGNLTEVGEGEWMQLVGDPNGCSLDGKWIAQLMTVSTAIGAEAIGYNWFYYDISHTPGSAPVINRGWDCSFEICGATSVLVPTPAADGLTIRNRQDGELDAETGLRVAPRNITFEPDGDGFCKFEMERWWWLRGLDTNAYYPPREQYATTTIPSIQASQPLPAQGTSGGDHDWDSDGREGVTLDITSPTLGWRACAQRDWNHFGPARIPDGAQDFIVPADFDNEESVFGVSDPLLNQVSQATHGFNRVRFIRLPDDTNPPTDTAEFGQWCIDAINEHFRGGQCTEQYKEFDRSDYFRSLYKRELTPDPYPY